MDVNTIQTLITSVGFPIVCVLALGWFIYKAFEKFTAQSEKREVLNTYKSDLEEIKSDVSEIKENMKG